MAAYRNEVGLLARVLDRIGFELEMGAGLIYWYALAVAGTAGLWAFVARMGGGL